MIRSIKPVFLIAFALFFCPITKGDDFPTIKGRVVAELMKASIQDQEVAAILNGLSEDGSFNDINYSDLTRTAGFPHRRHTGNLVYKPGNSDSGEAVINTPLRNISAHGYSVW